MTELTQKFKAKALAATALTTMLNMLPTALPLGVAGAIIATPSKACAARGTDTGGSGNSDNSSDCGDTPAAAGQDGGSSPDQFACYVKWKHEHVRFNADGSADILKGDILADDHSKRSRSKLDTLDYGKNNGPVTGYSTTPFDDLRDSTQINPAPSAMASFRNKHIENWEAFQKGLPRLVANDGTVSYVFYVGTGDADQCERNADYIFTHHKAPSSYAKTPGDKGAVDMEEITRFKTTEGAIVTASLPKTIAAKVPTLSA